MDIPEKYKQLWNDWDVRVLILLSLSIQIVLIFLGRLRKTSPSRLIRMAVWSSYLLADWVASFVLGQLSSTMDDSSSSSNAVLAFWAPFLLLHLGGPDTITAYSIEDNELWARHLLSLSYELIVVVYVLFRSLPSNRLLAPTLLIFLVAIIKYVERSYSLYRASTEVSRDSIISSAERELPTGVYLNISTIEDLNALNKAFLLYSACKPFFVDFIPGSENLVETSRLVKEMTALEALRAMNMELSYAYDELYTKAIANHSRVGYVLRVVCSVCIMLAFSLFVLAPKDGFDKFDVAITYVLLTASVCLDAAAAVMLMFSDWMVVSLLSVKKMGKWGVLLAERVLRIRRLWHKRKYWWGVIPQLNLMSNCLKNYAPNEGPRQRLMNWITKKLSFVQETKLYLPAGSYLGTYTLCTLQPVQATQELQEIIASYAQRCVRVSREEMNKPAGLSALQQVITKPGWAINSFSKLTKGLSLDQQVTVWHIATELCYHWKPEYSFHPLHHRQTEMETEDNRSEIVKIRGLEMEACKCLSNYMMHMVLMRPEMMSSMGGASSVKLWDACFYMKNFPRRYAEDHSVMINARVEEVCRAMMTSTINKKFRSLPLFDIGRLLAHLMLFIREEERWHVVTTVWVELMIRVSMNTRASMHLKQLSRGGVDLLTFIWLLTQIMCTKVPPDIFGINPPGDDVLDICNQLRSKINPHLRNQH